MSEYLKQESNLTKTENGAVTYRSTGSGCLDLFATVGAMRSAEDSEIIKKFVRAYSENPDTAMKLIFFARDVRGGLGERRVFRVAFRWLAENEPMSVKKNLAYVAEYGRFDDLLSLMGTSCEKEMLSVIADQFDADKKALIEEGAVSLLAKWLPSVNASNTETRRNGKKIAKALGLSEAEYRKTLSALRTRLHILENNLREKDYTFDYEKQPSRALYKYRKAFVRNDGERYSHFITASAQGKAVLHAEHIAPYELIEPYLKAEWVNDRGFMKNITPKEKDILNATWNALPDFGSDEDALAIVDTSGSMYYRGEPLPAAVALSLGLYLAEHNKGAFRNHFIEFSARPQLIELKGESFADRLRYAASFNETANTNLEAVFDLILRAAITGKLPQNALPAKLVIISDMEFDACFRNTSTVNFKNAQARFEANGYRLPQVIFWNVAARNRQQPVTRNEQGVALISGVTPRIFSMLAGGMFSPYSFMMEILESDRYKKIAA